MDWILASASPRRKALLGEIVEKFEIIPATGEEKTDSNLSPKQIVIELAKAKAQEVALLPQAQGKAVLGADTIVVLDGEILGKPKDERDATRMLTALSGKTHFVYTGVCIALPFGAERKLLCDVEETEVVFEKLSKAQIEKYISTGSPMDKAGAYGIQDGGLVKEIKGSFSSVVGLPVELCKRLIKETENG